VIADHRRTLVLRPPAECGSWCNLLVGTLRTSRQPKTYSAFEISSRAGIGYARDRAEKALREFLTRVERVNCDRQFLGRVNRVVLFGSMLREDVARVSEVDLAVEVLPKS
jgi:hypothetical protein